MAVSDKQYRAVLDLVGDAHDAQDLDELRGLLLPSLRRLVPADYSSYNEVTAALTHAVGTPDGTRVLLIDSPTDAMEPALLESLGLTSREAEVLSRLARGRSTAEVAQDLGVTARTVHKHCERIHRKLGVRDRAGAVATAWAATVAGRV